MRVFLDTNILLDIIEGRQKFLLASSNVYDLGVRGHIQMFATPLTFANCVYTARKNVGYEQAINGLINLKKYVRTAAMDDVQVTDALCSDLPDFEDMLQYKSAVAPNVMLLSPEIRNAISQARGFLCFHPKTS